MSEGVHSLRCRVSSIDTWTKWDEIVTYSRCTQCNMVGKRTVHSRIHSTGIFLSLYGLFLLYNTFKMLLVHNITSSFHQDSVIGQFWDENVT